MPGNENQKHEMPATSEVPYSTTPGYGMHKEGKYGTSPGQQSPQYELPGGDAQRHELA
jgi:hypothetical protein